MVVIVLIIVPPFLHSLLTKFRAFGPGCQGFRIIGFAVGYMGGLRVPASSCTWRIKGLSK